MSQRTEGLKTEFWEELRYRFAVDGREIVNQILIDVMVESTEKGIGEGATWFQERKTLYIDQLYVVCQLCEKIMCGFSSVL